MTLALRIVHFDLAHLATHFTSRTGFTGKVREVMHCVVVVGKSPVFGGTWVMKDSTAHDSVAYCSIACV